MPEGNKCADCGYLSAWNKDTRELVSAERRFRDTGRMPPNIAGVPIYDVNPLCAADRKIGGANGRDLTDELSDSDRKLEIDRIHDCSDFTPLKVGLSPHKHLEMHQLDEQRKFHKEIANLFFEHQARMAADAETGHRETIKVAKQHHWIGIAVVGIGATAVLAGAQIIAAIIPLWFQKPQPQPIIIQQPAAPSPPATRQSR